MQTVFTYGGKNHYSPNKKAMIELRQSEDKNGRFILSYGCEVKPSLSYSQACKELGAAILHHLTCESIVNNEGV
jgi:hypothetical protein